MFVDWYCSEDRYSNRVLLQLLAELLDFLLDVPHLGHLTEHLGVRLEDSCCALTQPDRICEDQLNETNATLHLF